MRRIAAPCGVPPRRLGATTLVGLGLVVVLGSGFGACGPAPKPAKPPTPTTTPARPPSTVPHGTPGSGPVLTPFTCPVAGARYADDFGPRGSGYHYGIDMLVPLRTPAVAVRPGSVHYVANEGAGGNVAYLFGDDHNVYLYAHLNDFAGTDRRVAAGQLLAHAGQTGNATAPHVHFEIRLGGANGTRVDAYQTLRANHC